MLQGSVAAAVALIGTLVAPLPGAAQVKAPIFEPEQTKALSLKEAKAAGDFKHGNRLVITRKDDAQMTGTLVRVDRKGKRLFLRTRPGEPPLAVANADVKKAEVVMIPAAGGPEQPDNQPEIHCMDIRQGTVTLVHYFAPALSPGERTSLTLLEAAENEMAPAKAQAGLMAQYMQNEQAQERWRRIAQETYYRAQTSLYCQAVTYNGNLPSGGGYGFGYYGGGYFPIGAYYGPPLITPPDMGNEGVFKSALAATLARGPRPEVIQKTSENLARAQRNAVYEDGQLVAVVYEEPKK
jgi:hypothetical protein